MIKEILNKLSRKEDLSNQEMQDVVNHIMCGEVDDNPLKQYTEVIPEIWCPKTPLEMPGVRPRRGQTARRVQLDVRRHHGREIALTHGQKGAC